jgi:hypothetical protein
MVPFPTQHAVRSLLKSQRGRRAKDATHGQMNEVGAKVGTVNRPELERPPRNEYALSAAALRHWSLGESARA